ncbi:MAG: response regulator [Nitrospira sp.]|nr:response regulator [Nitrospira sp.]
MKVAEPILLADDNSGDVELILAALGDHRMAEHIVVCRDGAEVLDYLYCRGPFAFRQRGNPLVVLLDLKIPTVDGLEVLRVMKADATLRAIPVVILTSSREERDLRESYALGANAYVVKPEELTQFVSRVKEFGSCTSLIDESQADPL